MDLAAGSAQPADLSRLADAELFEFLPARKSREENDQQSPLGGEEEAVRLTLRERQALDELWGRHSRSVEQHLRNKIYSCGSTLCPPEEPDKNHFLHMCLNEAYMAFVRRTHKDRYENFAGYLFTLTLKVTLDVRKQLTKKRSRKNAGANEAAQNKKSGPPIEMVSLDETKLLVDEGREPIQIVAARELREVLASVLEEHAGGSRKRMLSAKVLDKRYREQKTWQDIAEELLPAGVDARTLGAKIKAMRDLAKPDKIDVCRRLKQHKVTDIHVFEL